MVSYHNTTQCHDPEELNLNLHCHESLKTCTGGQLWMMMTYLRVLT